MSFGQFLLDLLAVWVWIAAVCVWIFAMFDLFRRPDLHGWSKALWLILIIVLPVIGTCVYLLARPAAAARPPSAETESQRPATPWSYPGATSAEQLRIMADLADQGKITPREFQAEKARLLGPQTVPPAVVE